MLSKESIDVYLDKLADKILEKFGPEASIEIVVVGGAAIAINYTFRESTMDIDTFSRASAYLDDLVADVAKECSLPPSLRVGVEDKYEVCSKYYREVLL